MRNLMSFNPYKKSRNFYARSAFSAVLLAVLVLLPGAMTVSASAAEGTLSEGGSATENGIVWTNEETGNQAVISDREGLFSESEAEAVLESEKSITSYANVLVLTDATSDYQATAKNTLLSLFGTSADATVFYIDMNPGDRHIYIYSTNGAYSLLTEGKAYTITDNTYTYARDGDYAGCAVASLGQMYTVLQNGHIPQPMKWIGCLMISLSLSSVIMFFVLQVVVSQNERVALQPMHNLRTNGSRLNYVTYRTERHYSPQSSGSGGGGGGGGFSGGGGGGGFSGGGGGHSF